MDKQVATDDKIMDKAVADGTLVAYGNDVNVIHQDDTDTHDFFWSAMSMAGVPGMDPGVATGRAAQSSLPQDMHYI